MGNKSRFLSHIESAINQVSFSGARALDLFSGSGIVARKLAEQRPVVASDIQAYSKVLVKALTSPSPPVGLEELLQSADQFVASAPRSILDLIRYEETALCGNDAVVLAGIVDEGSIIGCSHTADIQLRTLKERVLCDLNSSGGLTLFRHYGGVYFSYRQALELDAISFSISALGDSERNTALAALLGTASDVVSTVGSHFAQPLRPRDGRGKIKSGFVTALTRARDSSVRQLFATWINRYKQLIPVPHPCEAQVGDFREVLMHSSDSVDVIYADPPYTRDHYSRFYHVLETIALGDEPGVTLSTQGQRKSASRGLYRVHRHQSPFSIKSQVIGAFSALFEHCDKNHTPLVLSYSPSNVGTPARPNPRLLAVPQLLELAQPYFREVHVLPTDEFAHSKFNRRELNTGLDYEAEILIVGTY